VDISDIYIALERLVGPIYTYISIAVVAFHPGEKQHNKTI